MSTKAKLIFLGSCLVSTIIIYKVHNYQNEERNRMRLGVYKDLERRQTGLNENIESEQRKAHNLHMLSEQAKLTQRLSESSKSN